MKSLAEGDVYPSWGMVLFDIILGSLLGGVYGLLTAAFTQDWKLGVVVCVIVGIVVTAQTQTQRMIRSIARRGGEGNRE